VKKAACNLFACHQAAATGLLPEEGGLEEEDDSIGDTETYATDISSATDPWARHPPESAKPAKNTSKLKGGKY
jgi:hypothetical protein